MMPDSIMYQGGSYVVLEADCPEQLLTAPELKAKLAALVRSQPELLPRELQSLTSLDQQIEGLLDNYFELDLGPGQFLQWYVVRLEKP